MKLNTIGTKTLYGGEHGQAHVVGINVEKFKLISGILRDSIYSDKIMTPIRELIANAIDEHKKYNVQEDIIVSLTTKSWSVRDFGRGLSESEVYSVFGMYLESTKDQSNDLIGGFGVGSKSMFAYDASTVATITSFFEGRQTVYSMFLDQEEIKIIKVAEKHSEEPSGMLVSFDIKHYNEFFNKTTDFIWRCRPETKISFFVAGQKKEFLKREETIDFDGFSYSMFSIDYSNGHYTRYMVRMGDVCYLLPHSMTRKLNSLYLVPGVFDVPIGYFSIPISRESINDNTSNGRKFDEMVEQLKARRDSLIENYKPSFHDILNRKDFKRECFTFDLTPKWKHIISVYQSTSNNPKNIICLIKNNLAKRTWIQRLRNFAANKPDNYYYIITNEDSLPTDFEGIGDPYEVICANKMKLPTLIPRSNKYPTKKVYVFRKNGTKVIRTIEDFHDEYFVGKPDVTNFREVTASCYAGWRGHWNCCESAAKKLIKLGWLTPNSPEYKKFLAEETERKELDYKRNNCYNAIISSFLCGSKLAKFIENKPLEVLERIKKAIEEKEKKSLLGLKFLKSIDRYRKTLTNEEIRSIFKLITKNESIHSK